MAAVSSVIAAAAVAVAAGSAYSAHQQQADAADDQKEAARVSQNEQAAAAEQSRRQQIRKERVQRASIIQASQNTGVSQSSGELGSLSVLGTSQGISSSNIDRSQASALAIGELNQSAANNMRAAQTTQQIGSVAGSIFGAAAPYAAKSFTGTQQNPADVGKTNTSKGIFD